MGDWACCYRRPYNTGVCQYMSSGISYYDGYRSSSLNCGIRAEDPFETNQAVIDERAFYYEADSVEEEIGIDSAEMGKAISTNQSNVATTISLFSGILLAVSIYMLYRYRKTRGDQYAA